MPVTPPAIEQAPEIAQAQAGRRQGCPQAANNNASGSGLLAVKSHQLETPGLHAQRLAIFEPKPAEKQHCGQQRHQAHKICVELYRSVIGGAQSEQGSYAHSQGDTHHDQRQHQQNVVEQRCQAAQQRRGVGGDWSVLQCQVICGRRRGVVFFLVLGFQYIGPGGGQVHTRQVEVRCSGFWRCTV